MELDDCAFPLSTASPLTSDPGGWLQGRQLVPARGAKPRGPGMERADLLKDNGRIFVEKGRVIDAVAADDARVAVVGNPCNTNAMIAASQGKRLPPTASPPWSASTKTAPRSNSPRNPASPSPPSPTCTSSATTPPPCSPPSTWPKSTASPGSDSHHRPGLAETTFHDTVGKRGAAIIAARGASSAASAANALLYHVHDLVTPGKIHSPSRVKSNGAYGFDPNVWAGLPVLTTTPAATKSSTNLPMDDFARRKLAATNKELVGEREIVKGMLKELSSDGA